MQVQLRRGLPRTPGGEPWPPAGTVEVAADPVPLAGVAEAAPAADAATSTVAAGTAAAGIAATVDVPLRRGRPRLPMAARRRLAAHRRDPPRRLRPSRSPRRRGCLA